MVGSIHFEMFGGGAKKTLNYLAIREHRDKNNKREQAKVVCGYCIVCVTNGYARPGGLGGRGCFGSCGGGLRCAQITISAQFRNLISVRKMEGGDTTS